MPDLYMLLIYLGIAAVISFVAGLKGMGRFRRWLDRAANKHTGNLAAAKRIAAVGEGRAVSAFAGRSVHRLTIGVRILGTALAAALVYVIVEMTRNNPGQFVPEAYAPHTVIGAIVAFLWYAAFMWSYRLTRQDDELQVPTVFFGHKAFDLKRLIRIEDDGAYMLRLYFDDGRKAEILKYVEGRAALMNALERLTAPAAARVPA